MNLSCESKLQCIVIGGGALGLLIADALQSSELVTIRKATVWVVNRRPLSPEVLIHSERQVSPHRLEIPSSSENAHYFCAKNIRNSVQKIVLFFCIPPETVERVFFEWIEALGMKRFEQSIQIVFCNNGVISDKIIKRIRILPQNFSIIRSVFFVGALRKIEKQTTSISWNGGDLVQWGFLSNKNHEKLFFKGISDDHNAINVSDDSGGLESQKETTQETTLGFLKWNFQSEIRKIEFEKFYTNFMLAVGIGRQMKKNKEIFEATTGQFRAQIAEKFAMLWSSWGVTKESLLENLNSTVLRTGENFNSLSVQGVQGKSLTMMHFIELIEDEILESKCIEKFQDLQKLLQSEKNIWGV